MTSHLPTDLKFCLESEADTVRLAHAFAQHMTAGDVLLLSGGLAAGKTTFVRAAVAHLGSQDRVSSPTYALVNHYKTASTSVLHMDAYRLQNPAEFTDLGLEDEFGQSIAFIEWGASLASEFDNWLLLDLATSPARETARVATLSAHGPDAVKLRQKVVTTFGEASA